MVHYGHYDPYGLDSTPNPLTGEDWGHYYARHVSALTAEGLHAKSEIAAELGWRDLQIDLLRKENLQKKDLLEEQLRTIKTLTSGCEVYGLTETTPIIRFISALEEHIAELQSALGSPSVAALRAGLVRAQEENAALTAKLAAAAAQSDIDHDELNRKDRLLKEIHADWDKVRAAAMLLVEVVAS